MKTYKNIIWFRGRKSRYIVTLKHVLKFFPPESRITDLGNENPFFKCMIENGYHVKSTGNIDLDKYVIIDHEDCVTSFEVFEHLLNLYMVLKNFRSGTKLLCSVPLKVWFSPEFWNEKNEWDQHFHEFSERQFLKLLIKTDWRVLYAKKQRIIKRLGIRQLLRIFWPSYLFVYAEKI